MGHTAEKKSIQAYKKVEQIKNFYLTVGTFVFASVLSFGMAYFFFGAAAPNFIVWMFLCAPLVFVIILIFEYMRVFDKSPILGKNWQARKIEQFMEEDRKATQKYRNR